MAETKMVGSDERSGVELLKHFCDDGFGSNVSEAALVLGRSPEEIESMLRGETVVDEDLEMKIRGIAEQRSIQL